MLKASFGLGDILMIRSIRAALYPKTERKKR
jgi:hypothetical protein